jgi:transposase
MTSIILGIDISKKTFDVALLKDNKIKNKKFDNASKGFNELSKWLKANKVDTAHACMEATGSYGLKLAQYFYENEFKVSVVNPARIKGFAQSKLSRVKTDKADSELISRFCEAMNPEAWKPTPLHLLELQELVNRLDSLIASKNRETNRLEKGLSSLVEDNVKAHITFLNQQIKEVEKLIAAHIKKHKDLSDKGTLLASIPGVGEKTIAMVLAFLSNVEDFESPKQMVAFIGLNPKHRQSGTSVRGSARVSKTGDSGLRKSFFMPAIVCLKYNPLIREFAVRLNNAGKSKMVIVIAAMRKLLHIIYGVLKNKTLFNEKIHPA